MALEDALALAARGTAQVVVVMRDGALVDHHLCDEWTLERPHALYSGTKSFWGPCALRAAADGLIDLDEPVAATISQWIDDPWKSRVTLRMLLNLTAGFAFGGLGNAVPSYAKALAAPLRDEPGATFTYGGIPLQVVGAVLGTKIAPRTPHEYLRDRVLAPIDVEVASWRTLKDGTQPLPTGAMLSATSWLRFAAWVLRVARTELASVFVGSAANVRYGLGWWLHPSGQVVYASGAGGQALYLWPERSSALLRFGASGSANHDAIIKRMLR